MRALTSLIFATPLRSAIVCGLVIAIAFGYFTHPDDELIKRASDLNITNALGGQDGAALKQAYESALDGDGSVVELDEDAFKARAPRYQATFPAEEGDARRFLLRHVGQDALGADTVYVWEETVFAAPWWSPHRFAYKAVEAQTGAFGEVVSLTFERDVPGLVGLLLMDAIVGTLYGLVIGAIVAVVKGGMEVPGAALNLHPNHAPSGSRR
jgi:hypothetical protein